MQSSFLETIKAVDGKVFHMPYHQKRYENVIASQGREKTYNLMEYLQPPKNGLYRCRLVYTISHDANIPHAIDVAYHKYEKRVIQSLKIVHDDTIEYFYKSKNRDTLEKLFSQRGEGDDILIIKNNLVTDTSSANIALYSEGIWITPKNPLLKGTTRARLLDEGKIIEADIEVGTLQNFTKVALLNAMIDFDILDTCEFLV